MDGFSLRNRVVVGVLLLLLFLVPIVFILVFRDNPISRIAWNNFESLSEQLPFIEQPKVKVINAHPGYQLTFIDNATFGFIEETLLKKRFPNIETVEVTLTNQPTARNFTASNSQGQNLRYAGNYSQVMGNTLQVTIFLDQNALEALQKTPQQLQQEVLMQFFQAVMLANAGEAQGSEAASKLIDDAYLEAQGLLGEVVKQNLPSFFDIHAT